MANDKYYGYTPKYSKEKRIDGSTIIDNRLNKVNPYEFRRGMDYELTELGCSRLQESTPEEREKATESVLSNLEKHQAYYTALIQFESKQGFAGKISETSFNTFLKSFEDYQYGEIKNVWKTGKMKDADHKNDKMKELKEAIKRELRKTILAEKEKGETDNDKKNRLCCFPKKKPCCTSQRFASELSKETGEEITPDTPKAKLIGGSSWCCELGWKWCCQKDEWPWPNDDWFNFSTSDDGGSGGETKPATEDEAFAIISKKIGKPVNSSTPKAKIIGGPTGDGWCCKLNLPWCCQKWPWEEDRWDTLYEAKKEKDVDDLDDDDTDKKASKGAKKGSSKLSKFDKEREAIEKLKDYFIAKKDKELEKFKNSKKDQKAIDLYRKAIELADGDKKKLEKTAEKFDVPTKDYVAKDIPSVIKDLEKRLKAVDKDEEAAVAKLREEKKDIALTDMTREEQIRLLNIISEQGISLREGSQGVKIYYEIAKTAFLEGLAKGLKL